MPTQMGSSASSVRVLARGRPYPDYDQIGLQIGRQADAVRGPGRLTRLARKPRGLTRWSRLRAWVLLLVAGALLAVLGGGSIVPAAAADNPVVTENQQPGTTAWQIQNPGTDDVGQIKGYASATSVNKGENITFNVSVNPAQTYTIDVYRIGWYQGLGGRLMQHIGPLNGTQQPTCPTNATTGMIACNWAAAYTLATQTTWTSGIYVALLTNAQGYQNYIVFAVRDDSRTAAFLYQQAVTTNEAYNNYPDDGKTGKSLYEFNSSGANTVAGTQRAVKVSFDRPYADDGSGNGWQSFFQWEINFVRWMEKSGYDVSYSTSVDGDLNGGRLLNYRGFLSAGHDEYWSAGMYNAVQNARDSGVNLAFFGANAIFWQIRFESSSSGAPDRVVVCYKDASIDPITTPSLETVNWRNQPQPNRPEQTLIGVMYTNELKNNIYVPYVVTNSGNWVYAGTGFKDGDSVPGIVGYEADRSFSTYPQPSAASGTYTLLSRSPFTSDGGTSDYSNSSIYQAPSGAWVFGAGTMGWSWALDNYGGRNLVDSRIQQATTNIFNQFLGQAPAVPNFTLAGSPASQTVSPGNSTSYSVAITPTNGFNGQVSFSVSGLPSGASASFSPNPASSSSTLSVTTSATTPTGTYPLTVTGTSGGLTHTTSVSLVVNTTGDFALAASPSSQTVASGNSASYSVGISPTSGFNGQVSLSVGGLPKGTSATFNPNPTGTSSTLTVKTSQGTKSGSYSLSITGVSGNLSHSAAATLTVAKR
jgi:hypothetical protein